MGRVTVLEHAPQGVYGQWGSKDVMANNQEEFLQKGRSKRVQHVMFRCCYIKGKRL